MSGCGPTDRTARWLPSEPPRWTIRRTAAILAASLLLLVVAGVPAWAGASFVEPDVEADADQALTLTVTDPTDEEAEAYGDTVRVTVVAPVDFTILGCGDTPVGWNCTMAEDGTRITFTTPLPLGDSRDFGFSVHTSPVNGPYAFRVTQADGPPPEEGEEPPATVTDGATVTVTGGRAPEPEPTSPADDGGSQDGGGSQDDDTTQDTSTQDDSTQDTGTQDDGETVPDAEADAASSDDSSTSGGSTAPRRTQGRTSGTTLEITPGEPTGDDPAIAPPDVADDPAIAPPDDGATTSDSTAVAATGTQASDEPGEGPPWQQLVGAAMLLAGLAVVAVRRWDLADRLRGAEPLALLRRWRGD